MLFEIQKKGGGGMLIKTEQINCRQETACGKLDDRRSVKLGVRAYVGAQT